MFDSGSYKAFNRTMQLQLAVSDLIKLPFLALTCESIIYILCIETDNSLKIHIYTLLNTLTPAYSGIPPF